MTENQIVLAVMVFTLMTIAVFIGIAIFLYDAKQGEKDGNNDWVKGKSLWGQSPWG